jgi:hypothetical protein
MKGTKDEIEHYTLFTKNFRLRNMLTEEKVGSQSENLDGPDLALAHRLVSRLESVPGTPG